MLVHALTHSCMHSFIHTHAYMRTHTTKLSHTHTHTLIRTHAHTLRTAAATCVDQLASIHRDAVFDAFYAQIEPALNR
jgi:hypothetical protein